MVHPLRAPVARSSALSTSHHICLTCRARRQFSQTSAEYLSAETESSDISATTNDSLHHEPSVVSPKTRSQEHEKAMSSRTSYRIQSVFAETLRQIKATAPKISSVQENGQFSASVTFEGKTIQSKKFRSVRQAEADVKLRVLQYIKEKVETSNKGAKEDVSEGAAVPAPQDTKSAPTSPKKSRKGKRQDAEEDKHEASTASVPEAVVNTENDKDVTSSIEVKDNGLPGPASQPSDDALPALLKGQRIRKVFVKSPLQLTKYLSKSPPRSRFIKSKPLVRRIPSRARLIAPASGLRTKSQTVRSVRYEPVSLAQAKSGEKVKARQKALPLQNAETIRPLDLGQENLDIPTQDIPNLKYGLDRVLFNPGVYQLRDPRSRVYNFDPYIEKIVDPANFDFASLDEYQTPSSDRKLAQVAVDHDAKYVSSTSAITSVLGALHQLLSGLRPLNFEKLSQSFHDGEEGEGKPKDDFSSFNKAPTSVYLKPVEHGYAIDKATEDSWPGILSFVGMCLEKLFTVPKEVFEWYKVGSGAAKPDIKSVNGYHYTKFGSILVRSQLDAYDDRLPGTGIFDIKTRAVLPIRMDSRGETQHIGKNYEIRKLHGRYESYEREFYDMSRATMMKYSLQARLGRMDGIFVAYHNIVRMFGFQYFSTADMDYVLHGQTDPALGDSEMKASLRIMTEIFDHATKIFPNEPLRLYFHTKGGISALHMTVLVEPCTVEEITSQHVKNEEQSKKYLQSLIDASKNNGDKDGLELEQMSSKSYKPAELVESVDEAQAMETEGLIASQLTSMQNIAAGLTPELTPYEVGQNVSDGIAQLDTLTNYIDRTYLHGDLTQNQSRLLISSLKAMFDVLGNFERAYFTSFPEHIDEQTSWNENKVAQNTEQTMQYLKDCRTQLRSLLEDLRSESKIPDEIEGVNISEVFGERRSLQEVLADATSTSEAISKPSTASDTSMSKPSPERLATFKVTAQNVVDGEVLPTGTAPTNIKKDSNWEIRYKIEDMPPEGAAEVWINLRKNMLNAVMSNWEGKKLQHYYESGFFRKLMTLSNQGKEWRMKRDKEDEVGSKGPIVFEERH